MTEILMQSLFWALECLSWDKIQTFTLKMFGTNVFYQKIMLVGMYIRFKMEKV